MQRVGLLVATALGSLLVAPSGARASLVYAGNTATETVTGPTLQILQTIAPGTSNTTNMTGVAGANPEILAIDQVNAGFFGPSQLLTGVTLTFSGVIAPSLTLANPGVSGKTGAASAATTFGFSAANTALNAALAAVTAPEVLSSASQFVGGHSSTVVTPPATSYTVGTLSVSASLFSQFEGAGTIQIGGLTSNTSVAASGGLTTPPSSTVNAATSVLVTYTFSSVPEPASAFVLASGLLGLGVLRMRRRAV